ncbi:MAG: hypothetical protein ACK5B9_12930 [Flavobacteriia bacterium]|jgi:hypothetical protein
MALSKTKVQFLYNETENDLFAFFPEEIANRATRNKLSYSHIGQHSECSQEYANESREATKEEYLELYKELTNIVGYDLQIVKR